nr:hypothetical protein [Tanacetum cinerariifolium]
MSDTLRDIYMTLESRYVHEGRTIDPSFYNNLSDDSMVKFTAIGFDCLLSLDELICLRPCELVIRENIYSAIGNKDHTQAVIALMLYCLKNIQPFNLAYFIIRRMYFFRDRRDKVIPYGMILTPLFKNLKKSPPKRTRNVGKFTRTQLSTSSSIESPPADNGDFPSTKLSLRSYSRDLRDDPNMSKEQRETRGMFKNLGRALHTFARTSRTSPQMSPNDPCAQTMDNWPPGPTNPSLPSRVSRPPPGFPNPPPGFEPLTSTQPLFVNINNNTPLLHNNAPPLENIHHQPPNLGNQDFPNPPNILDFVHPNDMPHLHNMFCQCCSTTRHEIRML